VFSSTGIGGRVGVDVYDRRTHYLEEYGMTEPVVTTQKQRLTNFVHKHDGLLTTVGTLIVVFCFFLKEGVQEKSKDLASALRSQKSDFLMLQRLQALTTEVRAVPLHVAVEQNWNSDKTPDFDVARAFAFSEEYLREDSEDLSMADRFLSGLPLHRKLWSPQERNWTIGRPIS
jgi:hypothetical protein